MNRVTSPLLIEKLFQLTMAPGVFVMVSVLPEVANVAPPFTTVGLVGLAKAAVEKQAEMAVAIADFRRYVLLAGRYG